MTLTVDELEAEELSKLDMLIREMKNEMEKEQGTQAVMFKGPAFRFKFRS